MILKNSHVSYITENVDELRNDLFHMKLRSKPGNVITSYDGVDLSLPPCRKSLRKHIERTNYQTLIWNRADMPHPAVGLPPAERHGWTKDWILSGLMGMCCPWS